MMRFSTLILLGTVLLAGACGGSSSSSTSHADAGKCAVGALGCACTAGGACDPGGHCDPALHICVSNVGSGGAAGGTGKDASAGNAGTSGSGAAGSAGAAASGGSAGASGSGGSTGGTAGAGGTSGSAGSGGTGGTAGAGGTSGSAGSGGTGGVVDGIGLLPCGNTTCTAPQACCYKYQQIAGSSTYQTSWACIDPSTTACASCTGTGCRATLIECHGQEDCSGGEVCCGTINGAKTGWASLACQPPTQCSPTSNMCDPNFGQCPMDGLQSMVCKDTSWLPGYRQCLIP